MVQTQGTGGRSGRRAIDHHPADGPSDRRGNDGRRANNRDVPRRTRDGARRCLVFVDVVDRVAPGLEREDGENDGEPDERQLPTANWRRSSAYPGRRLYHHAKDTIPKHSQWGTSSPVAAIGGGRRALAGTHEEVFDSRIAFRFPLGPPGRRCAQVNDLWRDATASRS